MGKLSQRQIVAEVQPVSVNGKAAPDFVGRFAQVSGGEITAAVEKVYDGGARFPEVLCAPAEVGDLTVTRHYDPDRDRASLKALRQQVGQAYFDVSVYTLNCDLKEPGTDRVYAKALCVGITEPEGDSSSGAPATFSLTFSLASIADQ